MLKIGAKQPYYPSSSGFITKEVFVVVGGLSTGKHIAPMLRGHGFGVIHVMPKRAEALGIKQNEADYITSFIEGDDIEALLDNLSEFNIRAIIPGCEAGVHLADILNEHFHLETRNDFSKSDARRNKYLMQETIRLAGIPAVEQTIVNQLEPLLKWSQSNGYPVVLKPEESAGSDGVFICKSEEQVVKAFHAIMSKKSVHGFQNRHVVAQDMLIGDEFMVNTVSKGDDIIVSEIILGKKTILKDAPLYDYALIIGMDDPRYDLISAYVKEVLPVLGFKYGAAHTEVIITKKGPILVEVNCRLTGAFDMSAVADATGTNQVDALISSYINPEYFVFCSQTTSKGYPQSMLSAFFIVRESHDINHDPDVKLFVDIPGFHSIKFGPRKGSKLPETTSLMDSPGMVTFVGKNTKELFESLRIFREKEPVFYAKAYAAPIVESPASNPFGCSLLEIKALQSSLPHLSRLGIGNSGLSLFSRSAVDKQSERAEAAMSHHS